MQVGVNHYVQNQHLGHALQAQHAAGRVTGAEEAQEGATWQDDQVSWSDRLYELHSLAEQVQLDNVNFREVGELRQALYERGWISPGQATALTELGARLSDRLSYRMEDILSEAMASGEPARRALEPVFTTVRNISVVQSMQPADQPRN